MIKGTHHLRESKRKMSIAKKGRLISEETKKKMSEALKGNKNGLNNHYKHTEETKMKMSKNQSGKNNSFYGRKHSEEVRERVSDTHKGKNHWNWQEGKSCEPYSVEFNESLKELIRNRDDRKCRVCGKTEKENSRKLDVHHINGDKKDCDVKNLISLCMNCHRKLHEGVLL